MSNKKSNIEYLRDLISDYMGDKHKDEALEFLEAIQTDQSEMKEEIKDLENREDPEPDEPEYDNEIDVRMGPNDNLYWKCDNLAISSLMETLGEQIDTTSPVELERRIKG